MMVMSFDRDGYAIYEDFLQRLQGNRLEQLQKSAPPANARNCLAHPIIRELAAAPECLELAGALLGKKARAVKATFFDKNPEKNWKVPPHQDVTITVRERADVPGFTCWTIKDGVPNVQPPAEVLEEIIAFRFHLDDCSADNGALIVWPGSHRAGRLKDEGIERWLSNNPEGVICPVAAGGVMVMRPLLIHSSSQAVRPSHRRVIHIEYTAADLPAPLQWSDEVV